MRTLRPGEIMVEDVTGEQGVEPPPAPAPPSAPMPPIVAQASAAAVLIKALGGTPLLAGFVGGVIAVVGHSMLDSEKIVHRVERLEAAMISADEHNAWVQAALVALSKNEPLPPPPYRRMAPP